MQINLDTLDEKAIRVQKGGTSPGYLSILQAVPMTRHKVRKAANKPKQPARKAAHPRPFEPAPESKPSSAIDGSEHWSAVSSARGTSSVAEKPAGIDALLAAVNALASAVKITTAPLRASTRQAVAVALAESHRQNEADNWNASRSASQRQGFIFHAANADSSTVALGRSAHAVRMNGNSFAPAPSLAKKGEIGGKGWFNDSYMARLGRK